MIIAEVCAICDRARLAGKDGFIAGPLPADPFAYVGSVIVVCPDCLPKKRKP
jgi:hypothetical protein